MTRANGHYNGGGDGDDRGNITSIEDARRRAAEKAKAEKRAARGQPAGSVRDWIIGGLVLAMALGYFASLFAGASGMNGAL